MENGKSTVAVDVYLQVQMEVPAELVEPLLCYKKGDGILAFVLKNMEWDFTGDAYITEAVTESLGYGEDGAEYYGLKISKKELMEC